MNLRQIKELVYPEVVNLTSKPIEDFRIEEIEPKDELDYRIIVSFLVENVNRLEVKGILGVSNIGPMSLPYERVFKEIIISDGNVKRIGMFKNGSN